MSINFLLVWDFIGLIAALIALVLALRIVWRVEKKLDKFFKIIAVVMALLVVRQVARILTHAEVIITPFYFSLLDMLPVLIFIFALWVMNGIISRLDGEK